MTRREKARHIQEYAGAGYGWLINYLGEDDDFTEYLDDYKNYSSIVNKTVHGIIRKRSRYKYIQGSLEEHIHEVCRDTIAYVNKQIEIEKIKKGRLKNDQHRKKCSQNLGLA